MAKEQDPQARRGWPWMRIVLGLSLAANLLVVGLVAGAVLRHGGRDAQRSGQMSMGASLIRALPREDRRALRADIEAAGVLPGPARDPASRTEMRREETAAMGAALRADPFDAAAVRALLDEQTRRRDAWQDAVQAAWLEHVAAMSADERAAYAARVEDAWDRPAAKRHRRRAD